VALGAPAKRHDLKQRGIEYVLVSDGAFNIYFIGSLHEWRRRMNAQVVRTIPLTLRASDGPRDWQLVKLQQAKFRSKIPATPKRHKQARTRNVKGRTRDVLQTRHGFGESLLGLG
jgi:hypothetical protein